METEGRSQSKASGAHSRVTRGDVRSWNGTKILNKNAVNEIIGTIARSAYRL